MKAFMTTGTLNFIGKLADTHPNIHFHIMSSGTSTLAYYEGNGKGVFAAGRAYNILITKGEILTEGHVVMNNIPVMDEGKPVFEDRFKQRQNDVNSMPGFRAFRLLKPIKGDTYVVFTQWETEQDFLNWKNSEQFNKSHKDQISKPPAYFVDRPFVTSYSMVKKEKM